MTVKERLDALNIPSPLEVTGTRATTVEEWEKIRPIVREMMYKCEYGYIPEKPESVSFKVSRLHTSVRQRFRVKLKHLSA